METTKAERAPIAEIVAQRVIDDIKQGRFEPGGKLPSERKLMEELGVGRLSLREGLARLSALGIITVEHGKSTIIAAEVDPRALERVMAPIYATQDEKTVRDLMSARALIDGESAALAARNRTADDIVRLREILDDNDSAMLSDDGLAELDFCFHEEVTRIADNAFISLMFMAMAEPVRAFLLTYVRIHQDRLSVIDRHRPIIDAIEAQDAQAARTAAIDHLDACSRTVEKFKFVDVSTASPGPAESA